MHRLAWLFVVVGCRPDGSSTWWSRSGPSCRRPRPEKLHRDLPIARIAPVFEVQPTQKFIDFVDLFGPKGVVGDVCQDPDYDSFFQMAVDLIDTTCDEFVPEG